MIINYAEVVVKHLLNKILSTDPNYSNICKCETCIDDIMAKALNNLKPQYFTTKKGEVYAEYSSLEPQQHAESLKEIIKAIEFVSYSPNH